MELKKQPETEMEYWETIESLGGFIWRINHELGHGRIDDPTGELSKEVVSAQKISDSLVRELDEKFGVIHPSDVPPVEMGQKPPPAPEGKIYYWNWYQKMKELAYKADYEKMICSACPFSDGLEKMMRLGGVIPCSLWRGMLYRLTQPYECGMVSFDSWTQEAIEKKIKREHGDDALATFKKKKEALTLTK
ncbi:hypothetical protein HYV70_05680 [Candidatus Uhrbacteria bacterium]|nr:hypothetical protein [Candidatus Uhrbacteria bacterium]